MANFGFGAFAIGGLCGVAAVVAGALTVKPAPSVGPASNAAHLPATAPASSEGEHSPPPTALRREHQSPAPGLGEPDVAKILSETGAPNPYSWYRWHLIRRGLSRDRVVDLLGEPPLRRNADQWEFSMQVGVESQTSMHVIRFNQRGVEDWECNYIANEVNSRPDLFGDQARWAPLTAGSSLADVVRALGEPTRYRTWFDERNDVPEVRLEYKIPNGGVGVVTIDAHDVVLGVDSPF